jgi:DNA-binding transcriptional ArsR family regulator
MAKEQRQTRAEERLAKAISHPLRFRILVELNKEPTSPIQLAKLFGEPLPNVSYHVKMLEKLGAIELVRTIPRRGAIEHIYRATSRPFFEDAHWAKLPLSVRRQFQDQTLQGVWDHLIEAFEGGGLDHPETHTSWTNLDLDPEGFRDLVALLNETLDRALEIQTQSAGRLAPLAEDERETERTELTVLHFHRPRADDVSEKQSRPRRKPANKQQA